MSSPLQRDSRGGSSTIGYLGFMPVLMLLIFGALQVGMQFSARTAAVAAARAGADQARLMPQGDAQHAALVVAHQADLGDPQVTIDRGTETVTVTVTGRAPYVLWNSTARGSVTYPVERAS
ncbi:TadE/TadG family type IV pilus assembly protein [Luteococcus sp.]|uniref:TadE/TadG family type IV pilus assembly protein n=1 Tax=Luteococcus sp. TaxID=1969402 RepID=UPI003735EA0C